MPKSPKGGKRPTDVIGNAVHVMRIATGEIEDDAPVDDGKDQAAVALGKKGGAARAAKLTPDERAEIARKAAASGGIPDPAVPKGLDISSILD